MGDPKRDYFQNNKITNFGFQKSLKKVNIIQTKGGNMAYTSIHPIKATLGKSIDYICNHEKTLNGEYISSENCSYKVAEQEFEFTRQAMNEEVKILGFHAIQSFKAGEVTAEQAQFGKF